MPEQPDSDATLDETSGLTSPARTIGREDRGDTIGPWTLISPLGEGGFGSVWVAERRRPFTQRVALKLIKPGMDSKAVVARFEQERQALAVMNHPSIAKVVDGGLTERGRPYFAMELVKGDEITAFCDARRLGLEDRLRLFIQACEAVQHAHLKGLVHRDLKPSNILAFETEGREFRLKVIDFGVAKAMSQPLTEKTIFTQTGHMIGTPEYMSPEQADPSSTDIDTRSDVYSLGVLLYEMIVGVTPFSGRDLRSKAYAEMQRILREEDPPRPSDRLSTISQADANLSGRIETSRQVKIAELARTLRSELEWIPMMAMRKEPQRRYQSAMALADDLRNYLDRKPLVAAPESTTYRVRKYAARHKALVTGTTAVAASLVAGLTLATWQWRVAVANAKEAVFQARKIVDHYVVGQIWAPDFRGNSTRASAYLTDFSREFSGAFGRDHADTLDAFLRMCIEEADTKPWDIHLRPFLSGLEGQLSTFQRTHGNDHPYTLVTANATCERLIAVGLHERASKLSQSFEQPMRERHAEGDTYLLARFLRLKSEASLQADIDPTRFARIKKDLMEAHELALAGPDASRRETTQALVDLHVAWHETGPDQGHDAEAARYQAMLGAVANVVDEDD